MLKAKVETDGKKAERIAREELKWRGCNRTCLAWTKGIKVKWRWRLRA
jgi:hypothetical protein